MQSVHWNLLCSREPLYEKKMNNYFFNVFQYYFIIKFGQIFSLWISYDQHVWIYMLYTIVILDKENLIWKKKLMFW